MGNEIPKPVSPLPWGVCREAPGYSNESHILHDKHHYKVLAHLRLTAAWPSDIAYACWAANNAPKLAERIERLEAALREAILEHEDQADNWAYIEDDQNAKYHRERAATLRKALE